MSQLALSAVIIDDGPNPEGLERTLASVQDFQETIVISPHPTTHAQVAGRVAAFAYLTPDDVQHVLALGQRLSAMQWCILLRAGEEVPQDLKDELLRVLVQGQQHNVMGVQIGTPEGPQVRIAAKTQSNVFANSNLALAGACAAEVTHG